MVRLDLPARHSKAFAGVLLFLTFIGVLILLILTHALMEDSESANAIKVSFVEHDGRQHSGRNVVAWPKDSIVEESEDEDSREGLDN
eukprot:scaffold672_cov126-Cylindrotheca_fusiformis.AAC.47